MTDIADLFGIELPVIQAPMAGVQDHRLAVAVSNAGGLGSLPAALLSLDDLRKELTALREATDRPFNVNFFCHAPPGIDPARDARWRQALARYYAELDVDPATIPSGPGRMPFNQEAAEMVSAFRPAVVSFHFGLPSSDLLSSVRARGAKVISTATTVDEAVWLEQRGVDAIIAQGIEAGGHRGIFLGTDLSTQLETRELVPRIVKAVTVPVIAAGGIGNSATVAAVLGMGAAGVQIGSAYLLCPEATTSAVHRAALRSPAARDTAVTNVFTGRPARGIVNRLVRELGPLTDLAPEFPLASLPLAPLRKKAESRGSGDFSPLWTGTKGAAREIPAAQLTRELFA